jgi:hypothetical protein
MRRVRRSLVLATIFSASAASALTAQIRLGDAAATTTELTPSQRKFAQAYLSAVTGPDIERYKVLLHPATRACMNSDNADFFALIFKRRVGHVAVSPRLSVEKVPEKYEMFDAMSARGWTYPVHPTQIFHIEVASKGTKQSEIMAFGALDRGVWYEVLPCPSAKALSDMRASEQKEAVERAKARELAAAMRDPLRAELLALLKADRPVSAANRYVEAMHVDLTTATRVVDALAQVKP